MVIPAFVVTADAEFGESVCQDLNDTGKFAATYTVNPEQFAEASKIQTLCVIILDTELKDALPGEAIDSLRQRLSTVKLVVVIPNTLEEPSFLEGLHPECVLIKPVDIDDLMTRVKEVVDTNKPEDTNTSLAESVNAQPAEEKSATVRQATPMWLQDANLAAQHLTRLSLESASQGSLITDKEQIWAYAGELSHPAVEELAQIVATHFEDGEMGDLARFIRLQATEGEYMLYATRLSGSYVLSVVFDAETPFSKIRAQASSLAEALSTAPIKDNYALPTPPETQTVESPAEELPPTPSTETEEKAEVAVALETLDEIAADAEEIQAEAETEIEAEAVEIEEETVFLDAAPETEEMLPLETETALDEDMNMDALQAVDEEEFDQAAEETADLPEAPFDDLLTDIVAEEVAVEEITIPDTAFSEPMAADIVEEDTNEDNEPLDLWPLLGEVPPPIPSGWVKETSLRPDNEPESLLEELLEDAEQDSFSSETVAVFRKEKPADAAQAEQEENGEDEEALEIEEEDSADLLDDTQPTRVTAAKEEAPSETHEAEEIAEAQPVPVAEPAGKPKDQQTTAASKSRVDTDTPLDQVEDEEETEKEETISVEPVSPSMYSLTYACVLIPRFPHHRLDSEIAAHLSEWVTHLTVAFGWRLEDLSICPEYLQFLVNVPPNTSPGYLIRTIRQHTSRRMFSEFPDIEQDSLTEDFWAPGYLILGTPQPPPASLVEEFISNTRQRQGITD